MPRKLFSGPLMPSQPSRGPKNKAHAFTTLQANG